VEHVVQRVTALALVPLSVWFLYSDYTMLTPDHARCAGSPCHLTLWR